jgi:topoisomerase IA-like protein
MREFGNDRRKRFQPAPVKAAKKTAAKKTSTAQAPAKKAAGKAPVKKAAPKPGKATK